MIFMKHSTAFFLLCFILCVCCRAETSERTSNNSLLRINQQTNNVGAGYVQIVKRSLGCYWSGCNRHGHRPTKLKGFGQFTKVPKTKTISRITENCGKRAYSTLGARLTGGRPAYPKEYPWQVAIEEGSDGNVYNIRGGGVILNKRWVLTAAHVFNGKGVNEVRGVVGQVDLRNKGTYLKFDKVIKHENYKPGNFENDIALLHTTRDIPLYPEVDSISNICLPDINEKFKGLVVVTGWGKTHDDEFETDILMTVAITVLPENVCENNFKQRFNKNLMICAGYTRGGKDSCRGDSGGPLIKRLKDGRFKLAGIVSFGLHDGCGKKGYGAAYTKVSNYVNWIHRNMY